MASWPRPHVGDSPTRNARSGAQRTASVSSRLTSDGWQRWVKVRTRNGLARYSLNNQLLIALQAPDAQFVAGFHAWKDLGRRVSKGQHGIRILAPMPCRSRDDEQPSARDGKPADDQRPRTLFKSVAVFDIGQTEPLPGREPVPLQPERQPITGETHAHLIGPLTALADQLGYAVEQRDLDGSADGWCDTKAKQIVVNRRLPANARVRVLVHEIAHAHGIGYADRGRARAEVMVDCITYIVCGQLGLDTSGETIPYVAGWGEDGALDAIQADAQTIDDVARQIEGALLQDQEQVAA